MSVRDMTRTCVARLCAGMRHATLTCDAVFAALADAECRRDVDLCLPAPLRVKRRARSRSDLSHLTHTHPI
eukprot:1388676-Rhodomonas_salina.1